MLQDTYYIMLQDTYYNIIWISSTNFKYYVVRCTVQDIRTSIYSFSTFFYL